MTLVKAVKDATQLFWDEIHEYGLNNDLNITEEVFYRGVGHATQVNFSFAF